MENPKELFSSFYRKKDGKEDPQEFLENVEFVVEEREYKLEARKDTAHRFTFRLHLKEKAWDWYQKLEVKNKTSWKRRKNISGYTLRRSFPMNIMILRTSRLTL